MVKIYITPLNIEIIFFLCSFYTFFRIIECLDVLRPRGVSVAKAGLYPPNKDFTCLDGTLTIPFSQVNDDYCDCFDGSDEPGTSACMNGVFYCTNAGHRPENIPSTRVNDGVCDCCDASDEYAHPTAKCSNICEVLGLEARLEALKQAELLKSGAVLRANLIRKGTAIRNEMKERLNALDSIRLDAENSKAEKEALKNEAERLENIALKQYRDIEDQQRAVKEAEEQQNNRREAIETFTKYDSNQDGWVNVDELQPRISFDRNHDGVVSVEEAKFYLSEKEQLNVDEFVELAWPLIKPAMMLEEGIFKPPAQSEIDDMTEGENREGDEGENDNEEHIDDPENDEAAHEGEDVDDGDDAEYQDDQEHTTEDSVAPEHVTIYDEDTQRLVDKATEMRKLHSVAEKEVRDIDNEISEIKKMLEKDFGPNDEYASLADECLEYTDREYLYKLCPFDKASQQPKNGGVETRLGSWGEWVGEESNKYSAMMYTQGTSCWNAPNRSARVNIQCGLDTEILSVNEPNRCEYLFEIATPAACVESLLPDRQTNQHDEL